MSTTANKTITDVISNINKKTNWGRKEILQYLSSLEGNGEFARFSFLPNDVRVGDVVSFNIAGSPHPFVIFKIKDGKYFAIGLSTSEGIHSLYKITSSRYFNNSYITNVIVIMEEKHVKDNWKGVFDAMPELKRFLPKLRKSYNKILKREP